MAITKPFSACSAFCLLCFVVLGARREGACSARHAGGGLPGQIYYARFEGFHIALLYITINHRSPTPQPPTLQTRHSAFNSVRYISPLPVCLGTGPINQGVMCPFSGQQEPSNCSCNLMLIQNCCANVCTAVSYGCNIRPGRTQADVSLTLSGAVTSACGYKLHSPAQTLATRA